MREEIRTVSIVPPGHYRVFMTREEIEAIAASGVNDSAKDCLQRLDVLEGRTPPTTPDHGGLIVPGEMV